VRFPSPASFRRLQRIVGSFFMPKNKKRIARKRISISFFGYPLLCYWAILFSLSTSLPAHIPPYDTVMEICPREIWLKVPPLIECITIHKLVELSHLL
ncbi:hypothetical protein, partial [Aneurinibacillus sp. UBA3580]|uniref:hypothetical protein n=1 Tax=Aneurinibacillus sp. UBA3580 TaxID=1946041 RepID=UPI0025803CEE